MRYDSLMVFCWTGLLPLAIAMLVLVPSILVAFDISPATPLYNFHCLLLVKIIRIDFY